MKNKDMSTVVRSCLTCVLSEVVLGLTVSLGFVFIIRIPDSEVFNVTLCFAIALSILRSIAHIVALRRIDRFFRQAIEESATASKRKVEKRFKTLLNLPRKYAFVIAILFFIQLPLVLLFATIGFDLPLDDMRIMKTFCMSVASFSVAFMNRQNVLCKVFQSQLEKFSEVVAQRRFIFAWEVVKLRSRTQSYGIFCLLSLIFFLLSLLTAMEDIQRQRHSAEMLNQAARAVQFVLTKNKSLEVSELKSSIQGVLDPETSFLCFDEDGHTIVTVGSLPEELTGMQGKRWFEQTSRLFSQDSKINSYDRHLARAIKGWQANGQSWLLIGEERSLFSNLWISWFLVFCGLILALLVYSLSDFSKRITIQLERLQESCVSLFYKGNIRHQQLLIVTDNSELGSLTQAFNALVLKLKSLVQIADAVTAGQLDVKIQGEGDLLLAFRKMTENLSTTVEEINQESHQLVERGTSFAEAADNQQKTAQEQSKVLSQVSELILKFNENRAQIRESVAEIVASAELSFQSVDDLSEKMTKFSQSLEKIRQILSAIRRISHQSRMLALNIEIESSRLSDNALGLNAIATEARRLNEEVGSSVTSVRQLIDSMHKSLSETTESVQGHRNFVEMTLKLTQSFDEFTVDQDRAGRKLAGRLKKVSVKVDNAASKAEEVGLEARELQSQANRLQRSIQRIKNPDLGGASDFVLGRH